MNLSIRAALTALMLLSAAAGQTGGISGHYEGKMQVPNREVELTVDLDRDAKQAWIGHTIISPNPSELSLENISVNGTAVSWTVPSIPGSPKFEGTWDAEAKTMKLTAHIGGKDLPIELRRTAAARVYVPEPSSALPKEFEGKWEGALDTGAQTLRITLLLDRTADGKASGTLISVDQGGVKIPATQIKIADNELEFAVKAVNGNYKGRLNPEKAQISGDWSQFGNTMPLNFRKEPVAKP